MTVTYTQDVQRPFEGRVDGVQDEPIIPRYARTGRNRRGGVRTWMILAPIGAIVLGGAAAAMLMYDGGDRAAAPLAEPAATAPVLPATPLPAETAAATPAPAEAVPAPSPAPAVREAAPVRRAAPPAERRAAPRAETPAPRVAPAPVAPPVSVPETATLNTTPASPPVVAPASPPEPVIVVQPLN